MKVKNIMFSGFMAMVLAGACGAANAQIVVASQKYVDDKVTSLNSKDTELSGKITALETANETGGAVANAIAEAKQAGTNAQSAVDTLAGKMNLDSADSDLSQALALKENTANKIATTDSTYFTGGKVAENALTSMASDNTNFPTVAAAVQIADAKALAVVNEINEAAGDLGELSDNVGTLIADDQTLGSVAYQVKAEADRATQAEAGLAQAIADEKSRAEVAEAKALSDAKGYADEKVAAEKERAEAAEAKALSDANAYTDQKVAAEAKRSDKYTDDKIGALPEKYSDVVTFVGEQITTLGNTLDNEVGVRIDTLEQSVVNEKTRAEGEETRIEGLVTAEASRADAAEKANAQAIANEKSRAEGEETRIEGLVTAETQRAEGKEAELATAISDEETRAMGVEQGLQSAIDSINNGTNGIFAQAKAYTDAGLTTIYSNASECIAASDSNNCILSARTGTGGKPMYVWISLTAPAE